MSNRTNLVFVCIFFAIAFVSICMSQNYDRHEVPHYLCWISFFAFFGMFARHLYIVSGDKE